MELHEDDLKYIIAEVMKSIRVNSRRIEDLTPVTTFSDTASVEITGGKRILLTSIIEKLKEKLPNDSILQLPALIDKVASRHTTDHVWINLTPFFFKDSYFSIYEEKGYEMGKNLEHSDFDCITIKVKRGDMFWVTIKGGGQSGRAWCLYDDAGNILGYAEPDAVMDYEKIEIEQDGYITFTALKSHGYHLTGSFSFFNDHNWQYLVPLMQQVSGLIDDATSLKEDVDSAELNISNLEMRMGTVTESTADWKSGYIKTSDGSNAVGKVDFSPVIQDNYCHRIVKCRQGDKFVISVYGGTFYGRTWNFLNADKEVISQSSDGNIQGLEITAPANTAYLVLNSTNRTGTVEYRLQGNEKKSLKVLCFGNSFTEDSMGYVPMILKNIAPEVDVTIGIAFIGGCSLQQHLANFRNEPFNDGTEDYEPQLYTYHKSIGGSPWETRWNWSAGGLLTDEPWDIITFQQNGAQSWRDWDKYIAPYILPLYKLTGQFVTHPVKWGWLLTQSAYATNDNQFRTFWKGNAENARRTAETTGCVVFPFGTAVQNLRTTELKTLGDGTAHNLTVDNGHLQEGVGCYAAALANCLKILQLAGVDNRGVLGDLTEITDATLAEWNVPGQHPGTGILSLNTPRRLLAQQAAMAAVANPYYLTEIETGKLTNTPTEELEDVRSQLMSELSYLQQIHSEDYTILLNGITANGNAISALTSRVSVLENAGYATQTWVQNRGYLTQHQTLHTLTIQKNGTTVGTFKPDKDATINITDVASASSLSSHTNDTTSHITSTERTSWNKVVTDFNSLVGSGGKMEAILAFLDSFEDTDTLTGLLSAKADRTEVTALTSRVSVLENAGYATQNWVKRQGFLTEVTGYLPLSGGTMSGNINFKIGETLFTQVGADTTYGIWLQYGTDYINIRDGQLWKNNSAKFWNSSNDGAGSGLDADMLDGLHEGSFMRQGMGNLTSAAQFDAILRCQTNSIYDYPDTFEEAYGTVVTFNSGTGNFGGQFFLPRHPSDSSHIFYRGKTDVNNSWSAWNRIAFLTDNVASASRLKISDTFTAWGQTFFANGVPQSVNGVFRELIAGSLNGGVAHSILNNSAAPYGLVTRIYGGGEVSLQAQRENTTTEYFRLHLNPYGGNVGVGTLVPAYKLDVAGTTRTTVLRIGDGEISWDAQNGAFHFSKPLYSDGFITALGVGESSGIGTGTGGSVDILQEWSQYNAGTAKQTTLSAYLGWELHQSLANYVTLDTAQSIGGDKEFINPIKLRDVLEDPDMDYILGWGGKVDKYVTYFTPTTLREKLEVLTKAEVDTKYVKKSGDTMIGTTENLLILNTSHAVQNVIVFKHSGVNKGLFGYNIHRGSILYNYASQKYLGIKDDGTPHFNDNTLWHSGNDGSGSGLDADLLDGRHALDFALYQNNELLTNLKNRVVLGTCSSAYISDDAPINEAGGYISFGDINGRPMQMYGGYGSNRWFARGSNSSGAGTFTAWREFAFTDSNVASAYNADMLDGLHAGEFVRFSSSMTTNGGNIYRFMGYGYNTQDSVWRTSGPALGFGANALYHKLIQGSASQNSLWLKSCNNGTYTDWREFAFTDSNVASATKLAKTCYLWGQWFDGNGLNITGTLQDVGNIIPQGHGEWKIGAWDNHFADIAVGEHYSRLESPLIIRQYKPQPIEFYTNAIKHMTLTPTGELEIERIQLNNILLGYDYDTKEMVISNGGLYAPSLRSPTIDAILEELADLNHRLVKIE